jgi:hypothetical protein
MPDRPIETLILWEFNKRASQLYESGNHADFVRFVLSGITPEGSQAKVDVWYDRVRPEDHQELEVSRDIDSLLSISRDLVFRNVPFTVYPLAIHSDTLTKGLHFKYSFTNTTVSILGRLSTFNILAHFYCQGDHRTTLDRIPNLAIGKVLLKDLVRVFFLDLYSEDRQGWKLMGTEEADFYNLGLRPTLQQLLQDRGGGVPPNHEAGMFTARKSGGHLSFPTQDLPIEQIPRFAACLRHNLTRNGVLWGQNIVFLHQIRGVKDANCHAPTEEDAEEYMDRFLMTHGLDRDLLSAATSYIDIGMELYHIRHLCCAIMTARHSHIVEAIAEISPDKAARITKITSSKYEMDPASGLIGASGFRITLGSQAEGRYSIAYMQAYLTDKAVTYSPENGHYGKAISALNIVKGKGEAFCGSLYRLYRSAMEENFSAVRIECRVPFQFANEVLVDFSRSRVARSLLCFERHEWWYVSFSGFFFTELILFRALRSWRVLAAKLVCDWQCAGPTELRVTPLALQLTAAVAWLVNGIHSTPDTKSASRHLMAVALPRVRRDQAEIQHLPFPIAIVVSDEEEESADEEEQDEEENSEGSGGEDERSSIIQHPAEGQNVEGAGVVIPSVTRSQELVPVVQWGLYFLREIRIEGGVPRFAKSKIDLDIGAFWTLFSKNSMAEVQQLIYSSRVSQPVNRERNNNKTRQGLIPLPPVGSALDFNLAVAGFHLEPPPRDEGSDLGSDADDDDNAVDDSLDSSIDGYAHQMMRLCWRDMITLMPNRQAGGADPYCSIPKRERQNVTIETFLNLNLSDTFNDVQIQWGEKADWLKAFNHMFPEKGKAKPPGSMNWGKSAYYVAYLQLLDRLSHDAIKSLRKSIWNYWKTLKWIPWVQPGRMWWTKNQMGLFHKISGCDPKAPAPLILYRGGKPTWVSAPPNWPRFEANFSNVRTPNTPVQV